MKTLKLTDETGGVLELTETLDDHTGNIEACFAIMIGDEEWAVYINSEDDLQELEEWIYKIRQNITVVSKTRHHND